MSTLTKICVVVLVVLVLLACPVFITKASLDYNWKAGYDSMKVKADQANFTAAVEALKASRAADELAMAQKSIADLGKQRDLDLTRLQADLAAATLREGELRGEIRAITAQLSALQGTMSAAVARNDLQGKQLDENRQTIARMNEDVLRLTDLYKTSQSQVERLENAARSLREQVAERDQRIRQLETQVASGGRQPGTGATEPVLAADVTGTITAIKGDIASINIGSAQGVTRGMKLMIYRGPRYVGNIRIEEVDVAQAAGIIVDKYMDPAQGDKVTSSLKS